jgi:RNA polymerase sigma-B factor
VAVACHSRGQAPRAGDSSRPACDRHGDRPAASECDLAAPLELLGATDQHLEQFADVATIFAAAQHLSKRERLVLYLRFQEDLSQSEIARRLGVSQMHVSRIIRDALSRLRVLAGDSAAA